MQPVAFSIMYTFQNALLDEQDRHHGVYTTGIQNIRFYIACFLGGKVLPSLVLPWC